MARPTFSIVIPTFNEDADLELALDSSLRQTVAAEVVIVDDGSTDGTVAKLEQHPARSRFRLIRHTANRGPAAARNTGIKNVTGDVVVFVDADVRIPRDFLERIAAHYERGAHWVGVEQRVLNDGRVIGRFQQATHSHIYAHMRGVGFTQAFSCTRAAADKVRFPEELSRLTGGEDGEFFERLVAKGYVGVHDAGIVVEHRLPDRVGSFVRQQRSRGRVTPFVERKLRRLPLPIVATRRLLALGKSLLSIALIVPPIAEAAARSRRSPRGFADLPAFWGLYHLSVLARHVGELESLRTVVEDRRA